jgi:hypothetical protein
MIDRTRSLSLVLLCAAACGGGGGDNPDASTGGEDAAPVACTEFENPAGTIESFPGSFTGDLFGAGADLFAPMGRCTDERDWYQPDGEDQVVALTGLTPGQLYGVIIDSTADMSFYVASSCADGEPVAGQCLVFVDTSIFGGEQAEFTAPASGTAFLVVDNYDPTLPATDSVYTVRVIPAECVEETDCTDAAAPRCADYSCVQCVSAFDCADPTPACDAANTCVASLDECTGDDVAEPDDGPTAAATLAVPTDGVPSVVDGAICNQPSGEGDWLELVLGADTEIGFSLTYDAGSGADLDVIIWDADGLFVDGGLSTGTGSEFFRVELEAGTYYLQVDMYSPDGVTAAVDYTLTAQLPECDDSFDCPTAGDAVCNAAGGCGDGPSECTGDDAADTAGDDGPHAGRSLSGAVNTPITLADGKVCNVPGNESDWYTATTTTVGQGLTIDLSWTGATVDLDLLVFDGAGNLMGVSYYGTEQEQVTLTRLAASSTYYIQVVRFAQDDFPAAVAYSITSTRTAADACTTVSDCADEYTTQFFRGFCDGGACTFVEGAGALAQGDTCDSDDDCTSGFCSYLNFESDAANSVCTVSCTATSECTTALGAGYTCLTGLADNFCVPECADDLECGADLGSSTPDASLVWDYLTCTTGVCNF